MGKRRRNQRHGHHAATPKTVHKPSAWHVYFQRRAILVFTIALAGFLAEHFYHLWFIGKGGEVIIGVIVDRIGGAAIFGEEISA